LRFKKQERLRGRTTFANLFANGRSFQLSPYKITWLFVPQPIEDTIPLQVAFIVPKRNFKKAVHRNRIRRRMKEAYRLHKNSFLESFPLTNRKLIVAFYYTAKEEKLYPEIESKIIVTLQQLAKETRKANPAHTNTA
jgi:ribonuclease P protein component